MQSITVAELIDRLTQLEPRPLVERGVNRALAVLGWSDRHTLDAAEVIALGTKMAELAQQELAQSEKPADRAAAEELAPMVDALRDDLLPVLYPSA